MIHTVVCTWAMASSNATNERDAQNQRHPLRIKIIRTCGSTGRPFFAGNFQRAGVPGSRRYCAPCAAANMCKNAAAAVRVTSTVSSVLQTLGRCTLAFSMISSGVLIGADIHVEMADADAAGDDRHRGLILQRRCSPPPPRGMIMSPYCRGATIRGPGAVRDCRYTAPRPAAAQPAPGHHE